VALAELSKADLVRILQDVKHSYVSQYQWIFKRDQVEFQFSADSLDLIAERTIANKTGARGLHSELERVLLPHMFYLASYRKQGINRVYIDVDQVNTPTELKEANGKDIRAFVVNGEIVAVMERSAKLNDFRSNLHQGGHALPIDLSAEEKDLIIKTAMVCKLDVTGIDMLRSNKGPLILEVNGSPGLEGIENVTGVDVAGRIIQHLKSKVQLNK
jgi:hypothetical protein